MHPNLLNLDQKNAEFQGIYQCAPLRVRALFDETLRRSWIYHDYALDGTVLTEAELEDGVRGLPGKDLAETNLFTEINRLYLAIEVVRTPPFAPIDLAFIRNLHILCSAPNDVTAGRYRKSDQVPNAFSHATAAARTISYRMRKLTDFITEDLPNMHPLRGAAHVHHQLMQAYPFERRCGRAARLLLNAMLTRDAYPPLIIPAHARSEYHDALASTPQALLELFCECLATTLANATQFFERQGVLSAQPFID
jgi:Fic family protein